MEANLLTAWARLLVSSLADAGVRDVVLSPGSRSTPFVLAALRDPRLRCQDSVDERAAAFYALGQARMTGRPSLLVCTSGSAGAHYLPALVEACHAFLPVLALTADRPLELQHCHAAQTMDQDRLFGHHVRAFFDLGAPDPSPGALAALRRMATQAVHTTLHPTPGPVHLNARARKPLEPVAAGPDAERDLDARVDALLAAAPARVLGGPAVLSRRDFADVARTLNTGPGLVVCGPMDHTLPGSAADTVRALSVLAERLGAPVLCETSSGLRSAPWGDGVVVSSAFEPVLRAADFTRRHPPAWVLELGAPPVSSAWERYAAGVEGLLRVVSAPHGWSDPSSRARFLLRAPPSELAAGLVDGLPEGIAPAERWRRSWRDALDRAEEAVTLELREHPDLSELSAVRAVHRALPAGGTLMLGNSLPIRLADLVVSARGAPRRVLSQRGVNGIDGLVAGAAGAAMVSDAPVALVLGDVSLLHDLTSLRLAARSPVPLAVVVLHNQGGRIFEQLPLASAPGVTDDELSHVTTPHDLDFSHAARLFGLGFTRCEAQSTLEEALAVALATPGGTLLEVRVPPHDARVRLARIQRRFEANLGG
ncbi:MAG: 2-succinyl-5-enolpyruvyl-6-hydroxy-3-cyclohexene-1-carboxylic-acid synthase [Deltaproteobacteria bacterium]|nr:2-succinyl-5-enolpyruvyl-6-hydroxy-3-cyclohexene-1-carboxylic-acid synthase [Deltaproteobacteria bacterium]